MVDVLVAVLFVSYVLSFWFLSTYNDKSNSVLLLSITPIANVIGVLIILIKYSYKAFKEILND